jgi:DNA (cytosine-5)-methyltransferase 1
MDYVNLFAGPGGFDLAANKLGLSGVGIEWDYDACMTRLKWGLDTACHDLRTLDPGTYSARGLKASPPCQSFSAAGKGSGRQDLDALCKAILSRDFTYSAGDQDTDMMLVPLKWMMERDYEWVVMEEVVTALSAFEAYATVMTEMGYQVTVDVLSSEEYGIPQTRRRAILLARRDRKPEMPVPTHEKYHQKQRGRMGFLLQPWMSIESALPHRAPGFRVLSNYGTNGDYDNRGYRESTEPSATITSKADRMKLEYPGDTVMDLVNLTAADCALLQTFPADYPWHGTKKKIMEQIGNAIPPLWAETILRQVL